MAKKKYMVYQLGGGCLPFGAGGSPAYLTEDREEAVGAAENAARASKMLRVNTPPVEFIETK